MISFLEQLAIDIVKQHDDISSIHVVLPSQRAVIYFRYHLRKVAHKTSWLPKIQTIDQFIKTHAEQELLSSIELLFEFYEVYCNLTPKNKQDSFDYFIRWAPALLADFNEIDHYLCDAKVVFNDLKNIKEIDQWSFNEEELSDFQKKFSTFWNKIPALYYAFSDHLRGKKLAYNGMIYEDVARNIYTFVDYFDTNSVYFAGFNALSNAEEQIIQTFVSSGKGSFLVDGDSYYVDNTHHEAGYFIRKNASNEFLGKQTWTESSFKEDKQIDLIASPTPITQAKIAGQILHQLTPDEINKTAIVLADEQLLLPLLNAIPEHLSSYNISMGYSLFQSPLGQLVQTIFDLQQGYLQNKHSSYHQVFLALLDNFLLDLKGSARALRKEIIQRNMLFVSNKKLLAHEELSNIHFLFNPWDKTSLVKDAKTCFDKLIALLKSLPVIKKNEVFLEYLFSFEKLVNQLDLQLNNTEIIDDFQTLKQLYTKLLKSENVSFVGEPLEGLQIMGTLETRSLDFENIIMLSVNEGNMPKTEVSSSFIPYELKRVHGLPTFKEKEAIYAHHFYRFLQRTKKAFLIYTNTTNDFGGSERSRYLNQIKEEFPLFSDSLKITEKQVKIDPKINHLEALEIQSSDMIIKRLLKLNESGFSPTSLRTFINCPLDFYFKYVVGLEETEEVEETIQANTLGSIIHQVLENLYKPFVGEFVGKSDVEKMLTSFESDLKEEFSKKYSDHYETGKNHLMFFAARETIEQFLQKELKTVEKHELFIESLEAKYTIEIPIPINKDLVNVVFNGTIDRVDKLDGVVRLIDYKTGKVDPSGLNFKSIQDLFENPKKEKAFQLMLYYLLLQNEYKEATIVPGIISFRSINKGLYTLPNIKPADIEAFREGLIELMQHIFSPDFTFSHNEKSAYCNYC